MNTPVNDDRHEGDVTPEGTTAPELSVRIDASGCCGYANCVDVAPDAFEIGDDGRSRMKLEGCIPASLRAAVMAAVNDCPTQALALVEEQPTP